MDGIKIRLEEMVSMMGRWSDRRMGPGVAWKFRYAACLLRSIMSGVDLELLLKKVKKFGPRCLRLYLFMICIRCLPEVLECEEPNLGW